MERLILLFAFFFCAAVQAAEEFEDSVPLEVARHFSGGTLYAGLPDDFPDFTLPDGLEVIASLDRGFRQEVIFSISPGVSQGRAALVEALMAEGWESIDSPGDRVAVGREVGFIAPGQAQSPQPVPPVYLCHDALGRLSLESGDGVESWIHATFTGRRPGTVRPVSCDEQRQLGAGESFVNEPTGVAQYLPRLEIPEELAQGLDLRRIVDQARFGARSEIERDVQLHTEEWSVGGFFDHFAPQMREQGWTADSTWEGTLSAGGNFILDPEDGPQVLATLNVVKTSAADFDITLKLIARDAE